MTQVSIILNAHEMKRCTTVSDKRKYLKRHSEFLEQDGNDANVSKYFYS